MLFCAGVNAVARTEGVRALPSVGQSLTQSPSRVFDVGAGVWVCLCVRACLRVRAKPSVGRSLTLSPQRVCVCVLGRRWSTVSGGFKNVASADNSFVGGGGARTVDNLGGNVASGNWSAVLGGSFNTAKGV